MYFELGVIALRVPRRLCVTQDGGMRSDESFSGFSFVERRFRVSGFCKRA
jgi:hypothetical protein